VRRVRSQGQIWATLSIGSGACAGALINLATAGGHSWLIPLLAVLAVGAWALIESFRSEDPDLRVVRERLAAQVAYHDGETWTRRAIDLEVVDTHRGRHGLRTALDCWLEAETPRLLVLSGEFGSGKTWAIRRFARDIAHRRMRQRGSHWTPILISLPALARHLPHSRTALLEIALPDPVPAAAIAHPARAVLLLDGLDEIIGLGGVPEIARAALRAVADNAPKSSRFVVTCRTQTVRSGLLAEFAELLLQADHTDRSAWAAHRAITRTPEAFTVLTIDAVDAERADAYLCRSDVQDTWRRVRGDPAFADLAHLPFTIYLLEHALPVLSSGRDQLDLNRLYEAAVQYWLYRAGYAEVTACGHWTDSKRSR
jgi:NACHT domain